jgi:hypothetical protein
MQGFGFPPNPAFWDYVLVSAINATTGVITFVTTPLTNAYESTWPLYNAGNASNVDQGGPATIYALNPAWNSTIEYDGVTFLLTAETVGDARRVVYNGVTANGSGENCIYPSATMSWTLENSTINCNVEVDKVIDMVMVANSNTQQFVFQSGSPKTFSISDSNMAIGTNGTPRKMTATNTNFGHLWIGALYYGRTDSVNCTSCRISSIVAKGVFDEGGSKRVGVKNLYSMSDGVITIPNAYAPVAWGVPGTHIFWYGASANEGVPTTVVDVTKDATNTYVQTTLRGGFPTIPPDTRNAKPNAIYLHVHPAPQFTCNSCTGSADALNLSQAPPGPP